MNINNCLNFVTVSIKQIKLLLQQKAERPHSEGRIWSVFTVLLNKSLILLMTLSALRTLRSCCSYVCRRRRLGCGRNVADTPRSSGPSCCLRTSDIRRCCDRSFPPRWRQCVRYTDRVCRVAAPRRPLQGRHKNPPDRRHSESLERERDLVLLNISLSLSPWYQSCEEEY